MLCVKTVQSSQVKDSVLHIRPNVHHNPNSKLTHLEAACMLLRTAPLENFDHQYAGGRASYALLAGLYLDAVLADWEEYLC